jgi:uncharacterized SAM-binding protein YcdF (DUF218 family)
MKAKMSTMSSRSPSRQFPNDAESHRSQFRMFAALTMLGFIFVAIGAIVSSVLALSDVIGLPNETVSNTIEQLAPATPADPNAIPSVGLLLRTLLSQYTVVTLISFAALMIVIVLLLRKVILSGLRD